MRERLEAWDVDVALGRLYGRVALVGVVAACVVGVVALAGLRAALRPARGSRRT